MSSSYPTDPTHPTDPTGELVAPVTGPAGAPVAADGAWHRVHPLTPAVKSWQALVVVLLVLGQEFGRQALDGGLGEGPDGGGEGVGLGEVGTGVLAGGTAIVLLVVLAGVGLAFLSWRMTRYRLTAEALELHHGVLSRSQRAARLDRLQAVDVVQPLVARVFGLARLSLEVAGGGDSKIELAYLTHSQAQGLRAHLLARAAGLSYETAEAPEAPEHEVFELPIGRLFGSLVLSSVFVTAVVLVVGLTVASVVIGNVGPLAAGLLPTALGLGSALWGRFTSGFGFRVATSPDGIRLKHGLLEQRSQTVPPGRVQAVRVSQPLLWRRADWWAIRVNVAGYAKGDKAEGTESTLLPVASRAEAMVVLAMVLPDLGVAPPEDPRLLVGLAMSGSGTDGGFVTSPRSARWLDPLGWRRNGYRATGEVLVVRSGALHRQVDLVPHARTQSLEVEQGPVQRRLGLATFAAHSTPGPVNPRVQNLSSEQAAMLLAEQAGRSRQARAEAGPERWMEAGVPPAAVPPSALSPSALTPPAAIPPAPADLPPPTAS